jgi:hypothetical protein
MENDVVTGQLRTSSDAYREQGVYPPCVSPEKLQLPHGYASNAAGRPAADGRDASRCTCTSIGPIAWRPTAVLAAVETSDQTCSGH